MSWNWIHLVHSAFERLRARSRQQSIRFRQLARRRQQSDRRRASFVAVEILEARALLAGAIRPAAISAVSPNPRNAPVDHLDVTFSVPVDAQTFDSADVALKRNNGANLITGAQTFSVVSADTVRIGGLADLTDETGAYSLTVFGAGIKDLSGNSGTGSRSVLWKADFLRPTVSSVVAPRPAARNEPLGAIAVSFSESLQASSFDLDDVVLARDGSVVPWTGSQHITPLSANRFQIEGLETLATADGRYTLVVRAEGVIDVAGNAGTGSQQTEWQLDRTAPVSAIAIDTPVATSLNVSLKLTGDDPLAENGATGTGVASYDLFVSRDGAPFEFWRNIAASKSAATTVARYTVESNHHYDFRSIARDGVGNTESKSAGLIDASVDVPDLSPPMTQVTAVNQTTSNWLVTISGKDVGTSGVASIDLFVATDGGTPRKVGSAVAGSPASDGTVQVTLPFRAISDGTQHTYRLYSIGRDLGGKVERSPVDPADLVISASYPMVSIVSFQTQPGEVQRSQVRYVTVTLDRGDDVPLIVAGVNDAVRGNEAIQLFRYTLEGLNPSRVSLTGRLSAADATLTLDWGATGLKPDGYYVLGFDLDGNGTFETTRRFYRLQGDLNGDRHVSAEDVALLESHLGESGSGIPYDLNASGVVDASDVTVLTRLLGRRLADGLIVDTSSVPEPVARLRRDTGIAPDDGLTFDPTVVGLLPAGGGPLALEVAFDLGGIPQFRDLSGRVMDGEFELTAADLEVVLGQPLTDGDYRLLLRARSGNGVSEIAVLAFTLDTRAPSAPQFDLASTSDTGATGDQQTEFARVTLSGFADPGTLLQVVETGDSPLVSTAGRFTLSNVPLQPGNNTVSIQSRDAAGNLSQTTRTFVRLPATAVYDPVLDWNHQALEAIRLDATTPPAASRALAIMHSAILDAVSALEGTPGRYVALPAAPGSSPVAAVAAAGYRVLSHLFPAQQSALDQALANSLSRVAAGQNKTDGFALGMAIADALIQIREEDGYDAFVESFGGTAPGQWQPTAPLYAVPLLPQWGDVEPFVIASTDQFPLPGPPDLTSQRWADAFSEVKSLGAATGSTRTAEQTEIARFWADGGGTYTPGGHWNQIAQIVAQAQGSSLADTARAFAQLNVALADAAITAWKVKYATDFWRPITAIQSAGADGNDQTVADSNWTPLLVTPPFPEYVSGHSTYSGAAAAILTGIFGDNVSFTVGSFTPQNYVRNFTSFEQAAQEASRSRIYGGIHYDFSGADGMALGDEIGSAVLAAFSSSIDTQPPAILVAKSPAATNRNFDVQGQILDNLAGLQSATVSIDGAAPVALELDAQGRFTLPTGFATDGTADGQHVLEIRAVDGAGNAVSRVVSFRLDTQAPVISIEGPGDDGELNEESRLTGIADGTGSGIVRLTYAFDSGTPMPFTLSDAAGNFDTALNISRLGTGTHSLRVTATDAAGNSSQATLNLNLAQLARFTISSYTPTALASEVGVTFRPEVFFSRPVETASLNSTNLYATDTTGARLPATIVPSADGASAWLFFTNPLPGSSTITLRVDGSTIQAAADGALLDADGDGVAGGMLTTRFSTVSLSGISGTSIAGTLADPGLDLKPGTFDDVRPGADGLLMTADDLYLNPIANVKIYIFGLEHQAVFTDAQGRFTLTDTPTGSIKLVVDGRTATNAPTGYFFPEMVMDLNIRPAVQNSVMAAMQADAVKAQTMTEVGVYLPRLVTSLLHNVSSTTATTVGADALAAPNLPADKRQFLTLAAQPNSILGADGLPLANPQIGISTVPPELVQDMLPPGLREQHTFEITIQAPGATVFSTPVEITFPNLQNAAPGSKVNVYSFDHTTGLVVLDGTATVSADGQFVTSDPGNGIRAPGWHFIGTGSDTDGEDGEPCLDPVGRVSAGLAAAGMLGYDAMKGAKHVQTAADRTAQIFAGDPNASAPKHLLPQSLSKVLKTLDFGSNFSTFFDFSKSVSERSLALVKMGLVLSPVGRIQTIVGLGVAAYSILGDADSIIDAGKKIIAAATAPPCNPADSAAAQGIANEINSAANTLVDRAIHNAPLFDQLDDDARQLGDALSNADPSLPNGGLTAQERDAINSAYDRYNRTIGLIDAQGVFWNALGTLIGNIPLFLAFYSHSRRPGGSSGIPIDLPQNREQKCPLYWVAEVGDTVLRGRTDAQGRFNVTLSANEIARVTLYDPVHHKIGSTVVFTNSSGRATNLGNIPLLHDSGADGDTDGLSDDAEFVIGTDPHKRSTANDGVSDGAKVELCLNPLGPQVATTGVIAALPIQGQAKEIVLEGSTLLGDQQVAYIASGTYGLAVVDATRFDRPIILGQLDLPGDSTDVAIDSSRGRAVVAANAGGLHIVDVSDPTQPVLFKKIGRAHV